MNYSAEASNILEDAKRSYKLPFTDIRLLHQSENTTFILYGESETRYILRINRPDYHSVKELEGELLWMRHLASDTQLIIPKVYTNTDGGTVSSFSKSCPYGTYYSVFSFIEGRSPDNSTYTEQETSAYRLGETAAILHKHVTQHRDLQNLERFHWELEDLTGRNARWGDWRTHALLTSGQRTLFSDCMDYIERQIKQYGKSPETFGLIHGDLHPGNFINTPGGIALIDFDDCGYGWFLYEIGCSLMQYNDSIDNLSKAWLRGYKTVRELSAHDMHMVWPFIIFRRIIRIAWMNSHPDYKEAGDSEAMKSYIAVTEELCKTKLQ